MKRNLFYLFAAALVMVGCDKGIKAPEGSVSWPVKGRLGALTTTLTKDGTLTISGNGEIPDNSSTMVGIGSAPTKELDDYISAVIIGDGITKIGAYAFYDSQIKRVSIPESVTNIDTHAFCLCDNLTELTIPDGVTYIGNNAFAGCPNLLNVTIMATMPPTLVNSSDTNFNFSVDGDTLYVPVGCVDVYKANANWNRSFANIVEQR